MSLDREDVQCTDKFKIVYSIFKTSKIVFQVLLGFDFKNALLLTFFSNRLYSTDFYDLRQSVEKNGHPSFY